MRITLNVWRQEHRDAKGRFERYVASEVTADISFLELLDLVNEDLTRAGQEPIAFEHDCREGMCGACGFLINGVPHGDLRNGTVCQLYMRQYQDGAELWLEPWRAAAFPVVRDLIVDRSALDRIIAAGGFISAATGYAPEANTLLVAKEQADRAADAAACIGCGACIAACPNASAALFTGAKIAHLSYLPQGQPERERRAITMVEKMQLEGFGPCGNIGECEAVCPSRIDLEVIAVMNKEYLRAGSVRTKKE